jgi:hypothetical protein
LQIWPANPVKLCDGSWKTYVGGVDINFRVKHAQLGAVMKTIREDLEHMVVDNKGDRHDVAKL